VATVLVVDDAPLARETMRRSVAGLPGVTRIVGAASGEEAVARWPVERPSVVLLDVRMPGLGGVETARRLLGRHPEANVVMTTTGEDADGVARSVAAGARGYVAKDASREELAVVLGAALGEARRSAVPVQGRSAPQVPAVQLTERETQVLDGMARGRSNAAIGRELFLSEDTIKTHARRLFRKLGAGDRAQAVAIGYRMGLVR
jgi:DNA-binding NarL/FixJ family response regulator